MRITIRTALAAFCFLSGLLLSGCDKSDTAPVQPSERLWTVSGKAYLAGSTDPIPGVVVKCAGLSTESGGDGSYEIRDVPGGPQTLTAEKSGCDNYSRSIEVTSDTKHHIYLGFKRTNLFGYISNAIDGPIKGAKVVMGSLVHYTDISGRYEFIGVPRGTDSLSILHPRYTEFRTAISLTAEDMGFDVTLKRDSVFQVRVDASRYVDQAFPSQSWPRFPNYQFLYLRANGYDSAGVYRDGIERNILARFSFPAFMADERVSLLEADLQMCIAGPQLPFGIKTYAIIWIWSFTVTYNTQPSLGPLLFSGSIGDSSAAKFWTVLGTDGVKMLLAEYRAKGEIHGIEIKGG
ncbi:MAG: hypothetical protein HW412_2226, partial [Bacteroidetes bacterium]|nr:hypothetical protein [Bacteroidota bacterium]